MKYSILLVTIFCFISCNDSEKTSNANAGIKRNEIKLKPYPNVKEDSISDNYYGVEVLDPYRWLENDTSAETIDWVKSQNDVTFDYLSQIPYRDQLRARMTELWDYEKISTPFKKGNFYFTYKNDGVQNQSVLFYKNGLDGADEILLDPNNLSEDGTASINGLGFSNNAQYMAYGVSRAGSDWVEINIMNLETKEKLNDLIKWVKFSGISWEGQGFYYSSYEQPTEGSDYSGKNEYHKIFYHKLGTTQEDDKLVYEDKDHPQRNANAKVTKDEAYLILSTSSSTNGNSLMVKKTQSKSDFVKLVENFETDNYVIDHLGDGKLLVQTNYNAPNGKISIVDLNKPKQAQWTDFISEKKYVLKDISIANDKIIVSYMKDVKSKIEVYSNLGEYLYDIKLPGLGIANLNSDPEDSIAFYSFTSYIYPTTIFKYNISDNTSEIYFKPELAFNSDDYQTEQIFYKSKDGTEVPMFITSKKGLVRDGTNPTFLYAYGGFNISITPRFSASNIIFLEQGGIYAVANLRGGSEYGEKWHKAGWKLNKQNVFDDFIAAAEFLIDSNYTSSDKLAIHGRSNGGLLAGAVMTQRPDLMKVALPGVGVLDMLRYHKFTIGWAWAGEYGRSDQDKENFKNLYSYSPLHNIMEGTSYPATLVTTADHDDRVVPAHSFKFISTLQKNHNGENPVLIRIDVNAGHGAGKPTEKIIEEASDVWSFVLWNLNAKVNFKNSKQ